MLMGEFVAYIGTEFPNWRLRIEDPTLTAYERNLCIGSSSNSEMLVLKKGFPLNPHTNDIVFFRSSSATGKASNHPKCKRAEDYPARLHANSGLVFTSIFTTVQV